VQCLLSLTRKSGSKHCDGTPNLTSATEADCDPSLRNTYHSHTIFQRQDEIQQIISLTYLPTVLFFSASNLQTPEFHHPAHSASQFGDCDSSTFNVLCSSTITIFGKQFLDFLQLLHFKRLCQFSSRSLHCTSDFAGPCCWLPDTTSWNFLVCFTCSSACRRPTSWLMI